jgi:hypothetical protein
VSLGIEGLVAFVLFVFPGVIARAEAQSAAAIPQDRISRSWLRELADALSYSAFLAPVAALSAIAVLWITTWGALGLHDLLVAGIPLTYQYAPFQFVVAALSYVYVAFFLAWYAGGSRWASKIRAALIDRFKFGEGLTDYPIWWWAFEGRQREYMKLKKWNKSEVFLNVHIKGGGRYTGVLLYFTVAADTEESRDFALWKARYYSDGTSTGIQLSPDDVVLLNSRDCGAIEVNYVATESIVGTAASLQPAAEVSAEGKTNSKTPPI